MAGRRASSRGRSRWPRRIAIAAGAVIVLVIVLCVTVPGLSSALGSLAGAFRHPPKAFDATPAPPAPDYGESRAWMAFPGRNGPERSTPSGFTAIDEASAPADVFFIHPTTYLENDVWNAAYDVDGPYNLPVVLGQISAFNGCCRLYAPQYRQSSLSALKSSPQANQLAYSDVARAFRWYIEHENHGRPFIIAGHSQGAGLAVRLLQAEILATPLRKQLVAAYVLGAYVPSNFGDVGLPTCGSALQTGCIIGWNTTQTGRDGAKLVTRNVSYWWQGAERKSGNLPAVCVNPLTWTETGAAPASANAGSLGFPKPPYPKTATTLGALWPHLTGAVCKDSLLAVDVPNKAPEGYHDALALVYGSYHRNDFGMFYAAVRQNAIDRAKAFTATSAQAPASPAGGR
jgi:Protein of unknown function (DUF3089)